MKEWFNKYSKTINIVQAIIWPLGFLFTFYTTGIDAWYKEPELAKEARHVETINLQSAKIKELQYRIEQTCNH